MNYKGPMRQTKLTALLALLNVALLAVVVWQAHLLRQRTEGSKIAQPPREEPQSFLQSSSSSPTEIQAPRPLQGANGTNVAAGYSERQLSQSSLSSSVTKRPGLDWRQVESGDYVTYVKNLRASGCPEQTIRDIVSADVMQALAAKRAEALTAYYHDFKYWKADPAQTAARAQLGAGRSAVDEEMTGLMRQLLGNDFVPPPTAYEWKVAELNQQLGFLPQDKRDPTRTLLLQYGETDQQIRALASNQILTENPDERKGILAAYDTKQAELARLLTPEEQEQVELTTSWTAENLRRAMVNFQPTEEEFRKVFHEWFAQDVTLARTHALSQPDPGHSEDQVFARIKDALGEKRYAEYRSTWWK